MDWFKLCLLTLSFIAFCESAGNYYFVITPNVIRFNHQESVLVSIFGNQRNVTVSVWLRHRRKIFSIENVTVADEEHPAQTTIKVTEANLFDTVIDEKPRLIEICSRRRNDPEICKDIVISYKTGYLLLQTDKPIYTPRQKVKIRVLALDESLKTVTGDRWPIFMDIVSPSNLTMGRRVFSRTKSTGFYQNTFNLPPYPELGMWTARAFYGGQYETLSRSLFQVDEYVLPTFGVTVDSSKPSILLTESDETVLRFTVVAKYVYGKPVPGKARLAMNITDQAGNSRYIMDMSRKELENGIVEFTVTTGSILSACNALNEEDFPDGSRLEIVATVFESATGKEESTLNDDVVFAREPYIIKFTRNKRYFRPGMEYYLKIDVFTPNNVPAPNVPVEVWRLDKNDRPNRIKYETTDSRGQALAIFSSPQYDRLTFKVMTSGSSPSHTFEALAYDDKNQLQVERVITDDDIMKMDAYSNMQLESGSSSSYTGMLFVVVTRGKVVRAFFKEAANQASEQMDEALQELLTPRARLLVFYVDETSNRLVADSIKIDLDAKCKGRMLALDPERHEVVPGERDRLKITGTPYSWVGLNAMDKALLLLNDKNIMVKNQMFDALRSHDLGCGEGSGKNNGDVLKNAGLFVLTDALVSLDLHRTSEECDPNTRKKRAADECKGAESVCCNAGTRYANEVFNNTATKDEKSKLDSYTLCYAKARKTFEEVPNMNCTLAVFESCTHRLDFLISNLTLIVSKSLEDVSHYEEDLKRLAEHRIRPHKRTDFRESFLFEEVQLDTDGEHERIYTYPDSITEWMIQAIAITPNDGMCIADPVEVTVYRDFFVQLELPYKATRFELFDLKATLFSYGIQGGELKQANIYLESVDGLCYGSDPGKPTPRKELDVGSNTASTVRFPIVPLKSGKFAVKVTAVVTSLGIPKVDIIEKRLFVVNEGIQETITIQVCLDPNSQREDCENDPTRVKSIINKQLGTGIAEQLIDIDLALPKEAIEGTGSATAYAQGNIMDNVVLTILSGVDSLFRIPGGCSEQTMSSFAPNVYAMMYLRQTKQVTDTIEVTGTANIRSGVDRAKSMYLGSDGSYKCYRQTSSSVWYVNPSNIPGNHYGKQLGIRTDDELTAFAAKVLCHASSVVDDVLNESTDLYPSINFLKNRMNNQGMFTEIVNTCGSSLKGSIENGNSPSLTSFILITLLECNRLQTSLSGTIHNATKNLESLSQSWLRSRPFDLAITTYALALAQSDQKWNFKNLLDSIKTTSGQNVYWKRPDGSEGDAYSIETTAYALLAMLKFNDMKNAGHIVRWLTSKQNARGVFRSTQDTAVGLQALSQYNIRTYSPDVDLRVSFTANNWAQRQLTIKNEKFELQQIVDQLPVEKGDNKVTALVTGTSGTGRMRIELRYNRPAKDDEICPFEISDIDVGDVYRQPHDRNLANMGQCDVCGHCAGNRANVNYDSLLPPASETNETTESDSNLGRSKREATVLGLMANQKCVRFSVKAKPGHEHGFSMIYFNLETEVTVLKEDMDKLMVDNDNIDDYEMPTSNKGFIVFYLNKLTPSQNNEFVFRLFDNYEGEKNTRQPASVDVFDYYDPDKYCRKLYGTGSNTDAAVDFKCGKNNKRCKCLQSTCAASVDGEIARMIRARPRKYPALKMGKYTCDPDKANFADIVEVMNIVNEQGSKDTKATVKVVYSVHRGAFPHEVDDELDFYWKATCPFPKLETGKKYLIIAKDGFRIQGDDGNDEYRYSLMDTAIVIETQKTRLLKNVVNKYKLWMKKNGCLNK